MEASGAAFALWTLIGQFYKISEKLRRHARAMRSAKEDIVLIQKECEAFTDLLRWFHGLIQPAEPSGTGLESKIRDSRICERLNILGEATLKRVKGVLDKTASLRTDKEVPKIKQLYACFKWSRRQDDIRSIQALMNSVKHTATMFMMLQLLEGYMQDLRAHKDASQSIPGNICSQIKMLKIKLKVLRAERRRIERECSMLIHELGEFATIGIRTIRHARNTVQQHIEEHPDLRAIISQPVESLNTINLRDVFTNEPSHHLIPLDTLSQVDAHSGPGVSLAPASTSAFVSSSADSCSAVTPDIIIQETRASPNDHLASPYVGAALWGGSQQSMVQPHKRRDLRASQLEQTIIVDDGQSPIREEYRCPRCQDTSSTLSG